MGELGIHCRRSGVNNMRALKCKVSRCSGAVLNAGIGICVSWPQRQLSLHQA